MTSRLGSIKEQKSRAPTKAEWAARIKAANAKSKKKVTGGKGAKAIASALKKRGDTTFAKRTSTSSSTAKPKPKAKSTATAKTKTKTTWQERKSAAKAAKAKRQAARKK